MLRVLVLIATATACGSTVAPDSSQAPAHHHAPQPLTLKPGRYTFHLGEDVRVGDRVRCVTRSGEPAGGGGVESRGHGVGSSTGFSLMVSPSGRVVIVCPANPGNA
jgi:hypothetical protein